MALSERDRVRLSRQLLLPEIGSQGQERLSAARFRFSSAGDHGATAVTRDYLLRAGLLEARDDHDATSPDAEFPVTQLTAPATAELQALAGSPELLEAARALHGALVAVEAVKAILELGSPLRGLPQQLSSEDA